MASVTHSVDVVSCELWQAARIVIESFLMNWS